MPTSPLCRRCGRWHDVTTGCDRTAALRSLLTATPEQQQFADELEAVSLARYLVQRRSGW